MDRRPREKEMADAGNGFCIPKAFAKEKGGVVWEGQMNCSYEI